MRKLSNPRVTDLFSNEFGELSNFKERRSSRDVGGGVYGIARAKNLRGRQSSENIEQNSGTLKIFSREMNDEQLREQSRQQNDLKTRSQR